MTPAVAELLNSGQRKGYRREHVVARSVLADIWRAAASPEEIRQSVWDYRYAAVLTTVAEAAHIDRVGGRMGRTERYVDAGIFHVYDRLEGRDVSVTTLDPAFVPEDG